MRIDKNILLCLAIALTSVFGYVMLQNFCTELFVNFGLETPTAAGELTFLSIIYAVIVAPVLEELLFRFGIIKVLKLTGLKNIFIILISAFLFMLWHWSWSQTVYQFIMGVWFALIFIKTEQIWWSMLVHCFNNMIVVLCIWLNFNIDFSNGFFAVLVGLAASACIYFEIKGVKKICL
ncbi:MAG: CPBP family intramembrane metalloprotease [Christensenellaceae bacterium]|jgi:membrane protease YdiL (CAAX protease family)|nr:CPBP family intramembrane metalloprotease [Christensenellaceae bacterium]